MHRLSSYLLPRDNRRGRHVRNLRTQFTVRDDDGNYYKHLSDALASENVDDVTLLADDTLSADVTLVRDIRFFPNGHTVSGGGSIVVPSGKWLELREKDETEKAGNAGAIRVENGGLLMVGEDFTGTVQTLTVSERADVNLRGGTYGTITGLRQKAGTLLYYNTASGEKHLAFQSRTAHLRGTTRGFHLKRR